MEDFLDFAPFEVAAVWLFFLMASCCFGAADVPSDVGLEQCKDVDNAAEWLLLLEETRGGIPLGLIHPKYSSLVVACQSLFPWS